MSDDEDNEPGSPVRADITKPLSAFHHFSRDQSAAIKADLLRSGVEATLGAVMSAVSIKWKSLTPDQLAVYNQLAEQDRERYDKECKVRDEEFMRELEERQRQNAMTETETRMRNSTLVRTEAQVVKAEAAASRKRRVDVDEEEQERREERRKAKAEEQKAMKDQHEAIKNSKTEQAEARLNFLLSQSDIFSHFGAGKKPGDAPAPASPAPTGKSSRGDHRQKSIARDELDEDEREMLEEEEEDGGAEAAKAHRAGGTIITRQPSIITGGTLRQYQIEGLNWMVRLQENGINGILADEMGLGKTLQSISLLAYMLEFKNVSGPHLILVPKSTLSNWMNEFARFCPAIRPIRFHGAKEERQEFVKHVLKPMAKQEDRDWDVCITTYEICNMEKSAIQKIAWRCLIIDEAHRLKNEASTFSQNIRNVTTQYRLLLTGTPLQNNLHELWALLNFLLPDVFASSEQFDEWFNLDVDDQEAKQRMIAQLHKILRPFMLRRLKADVEKSLPPKIETILFCGLSAEQKALYRQILLRDIDTVNGGGNGSRTTILNIVMQLRKACNHPYLFPGIEDRTLPPLGDHLYNTCGKMTLLDKLLAKLKERGHRVLIFTQMTRLMDIFEDYFNFRGYKYCRIDGDTSYQDREDRIADYNREGSDKYIFLLSTRAGGLGINLQTADTVIIYDSDWNPQADLQAQDRCHRIGQKKQVHVFRLVTDDTVEVKVVERAQQKLKLDAMVVQQGRLQEKDKKMTKTDLLETVRFGADKIFRTKDSSITDDDIDLILEQGRKRTDEMAAKLQSNEKGDLFDFRLDGGMSSQVFEGKDYSDKNTRETELMSNLYFIDPGKRERKTVVTYNDSTGMPKVARDDSDKKKQLPRHLKLPRMEEWQFYNRARLNALQEEETKLWEGMVERNDPATTTNVSKIVVLPPELMEEKQRLLSEAFGDWTRLHYTNFVKASAKYGRKQHEKISEDIHKPVDEVVRYAKSFWEEGPNTFNATEWERIMKQVEKGEKRLEEIDRLTEATGRLIGLFSDPWEELCFRNVNTQGRIFHSVEDRYLLCLTHLHGYGNWDRVRSSIRRCERFRFDYYLLSCSAETLGKRCEALMRMAEKELAEIDKKKGGAAAPGVFVDSGSMSSSASSSAGMRERLAELSKQIAEEAKRLAATRAELARAKGGASAPSGAGKEAKAKKPGAPATDEPSTISKFFGRPPKTITDDQLPDLCRIIVKAGPDGVHKIVNEYIDMYPELSKRQVEKKVNDIAVKEKRPTDPTKVWHLKAEFEHFLKAGGKSGEESKKRKAAAAATDADAATEQNAAKKRRESTGGDEGEATAAGSNGTPSKVKRAFAFFVKAKRPEVEAAMGPDASTSELKEKLLSMWEGASEATRATFEAMEAEDQLRYNRELNATN